MLESIPRFLKPSAFFRYPRILPEFLLPKYQGGRSGQWKTNRGAVGRAFQHAVLPWKQWFFLQPVSYPREDAECYSTGFHTKEINLLFRIIALVISVSDMLANISCQNCNSLRFFFLKNYILMSAKQNYNGRGCEVINYSRDCMGWANNFTVELFSY